MLMNAKIRNYRFQLQSRSRCGLILGRTNRTHTIFPTELQLAGITSQFLSFPAPKKFVYRNVESSAFTIPQGDIDGTDTCEYNRTAILPPKGRLIQPVPDDFVLERVFTDDQMG